VYGISPSDHLTAGPGITALGLAAARSVETGRPDRLVADPFARALFEAAGTDLPMLLDWPEDPGAVSPTEALHLHGSRYIGVRTRHYDDQLLAAADAGVRQAVLLGAGLDTRALRLERPEGLRVFELDRAGVLDHKAGVLTRLGADDRARVPVPTDLAGSWPTAVLAAGLDPAAPTTWIAEGLLPYLPPTARGALLRAVHGLSAPGSTLALDQIAGDPGQGGRLDDLSRRAGMDMAALLAAGESPDLAHTLRTDGWLVDEQTAAAVAARYGRDLADPLGRDAERGEPPWLETVFLTARLPA
jgi:methyltransferase (TIGR00027 family)